MECLLCDCEASTPEKAHAGGYRAPLCRVHWNELYSFLEENFDNILGQLSELQDSVRYLSKRWVLDKIDGNNTLENGSSDHPNKDWLPSGIRRGRFLYEGEDDGCRCYQYDDGVWSVIPVDVIRKIARVELGDDATSARIKAAVLSFKTQMLRSWKDSGCDPMLLNVLNGMLDLKTGRLVAHRPEYYSRVQFPVEYREHAECPHWIEALKEIFDGNVRSIQILKEFFGYCLYQKTLSYLLLVQFGPDQDGKDFVVSVLRSMLGDKHVAFLSLVQMKTDNVFPQLEGKLLNIIDEEGGDHAYVPMLNAIGSGRQTRVGNKDGFLTYWSTLKQLINLRAPCSLLREGSVFYRGVVELEYNQAFDLKDRKKMDGHLAKEIPGIFNWSLDGLKTVLENRDQCLLFGSHYNL